MSFRFSVRALCPYTHIFRLIRQAIRTRSLPASARSGALITLLGLCCPLFWYALFTGASKAELILHAIHSGLVMLIGVALTISGLLKEAETQEAGKPQTKKA
ncbi:hypothetical protein [Ferrimonas marina]|uniref:Uncharacterized protein n=1 Tax=Ferrimonas marina TaxID=299255 RepID=A0A1M5S0U1_9GAMM|nr:hypothetical protein [Ferrimonas marina]SHH32059.1 hypothetical protein SAMN02745129_1827 [Ferrimonas marina]